MTRLYSELTDWYHLLDPLADHESEATVYGDVLSAADPSARTLLELGCGAGNNAFFLKRRFECTLTDLSPEMLALSAAQNPECTHALGDMRTLRLGHTFDLVIAHDAITYLATRADLALAATTAFTHLRPGGLALFLPDVVKEDFQEVSQLHAGDDGRRSMRTLEWSWDPDPEDDQSWVEYVMVLREGGEVRTVHDRHLEGLFSTATWVQVLSGVGFTVDAFKQRIDEDTDAPFFLCRRPV